MKPAQLCTAAVVLGVFAALVAAGAMSAKRDEPSAPASTIDVRVVESGTQKPVAGATIVVFLDDRPPSELSTDAEGRASVSTVVRDEGGLLRVRARGLATEEWAVGDEDPIVVEPGPGATVEGVVLELDGRPLAGAHVVYRRGGDDEDCMAGSRPPLAEATTGTDGAFLIAGVRADRKTGLAVTAARHVRTTAVWDPASNARMEVHLAPGGRISGVVRGPSGTPVKGARIHAWPAESTEAPEGTPTLDSTQTDASGRFEIDGVPLIGAWTLDVSKDGYADAPQSDALVDPVHPDAACDIDLRAVARIEVLVLDASGAPVTAGNVSYDANSSFASKDVGADGRCAFEVSRPGDIIVHVDAPCAPPYEEKFECASGKTTQCTLRLQAGVTVAGVVVDDLGAPVADASVEVHGHEQKSGAAFQRVGESDAAGAFRIGGLFPAAYEIVAEAPQHERVQVKDTAVPGDGVRVVLLRQGRVTLRLRLPHGSTPPKRFWIYFENRDTHVRVNQQPDWSDGAVEQWLAPGAWTLRTELVRFAEATREFDVAAAAKTPLGDVAVGR